MIAKAIANESSASFINVQLSTIMTKWYGDSNKLVSAIFSLAGKIAPSLIFIDEIDTFLRQRDDGGEASPSASMKSEFLTLWDGILTGPKQGEGKKNKPVIVVGATNRPDDVDTAILRRMPRQFEIGLPDEDARLDIIRKILQVDEAEAQARSGRLFEKTEDGEHHPDMIVPLSQSVLEYLPVIAKNTQQFSGSDLSELCLTAKNEPELELAKNFAALRVGNITSDREEQLKAMRIRKSARPRSVEVKDFQVALKKVSRTGAQAEAFKKRRQEEENLKSNPLAGGASRSGGLNMSDNLLFTVLGSMVQQAVAGAMKNNGNGNYNGNNANSGNNDAEFEECD